VTGTDTKDQPVDFTVRVHRRVIRKDREQVAHCGKGACFGAGGLQYGKARHELHAVKEEAATQGRIDHFL